MGKNTDSTSDGSEEDNFDRFEDEEGSGSDHFHEEGSDHFHNEGSEGSDHLGALPLLQGRQVPQRSKKPHFQMSLFQASKPSLSTTNTRSRQQALRIQHRMSSKRYRNHPQSQTLIPKSLSLLRQQQQQPMPTPPEQQQQLPGYTTKSTPNQPFSSFAQPKRESWSQKRESWSLSQQSSTPSAASSSASSSTSSSSSSLSHPNESTVQQPQTTQTSYSLLQDLLQDFSPSLAELPAASALSLGRDVDDDDNDNAATESSKMDSPKQPPPFRKPLPIDNPKQFRKSVSIDDGVFVIGREREDEDNQKLFRKSVSIDEGVSRAKETTSEAAILSLGRNAAEKKTGKKKSVMIDDSHKSIGIEDLQEASESSFSFGHDADDDSGSIDDIEKQLREYHKSVHVGGNGSDNHNDSQTSFGDLDESRSSTGGSYRISASLKTMAALQNTAAKFGIPMGAGNAPATIATGLKNTGRRRSTFIGLGLTSMPEHTDKDAPATVQQLQKENNKHFHRPTLVGSPQLNRGGFGQGRPGLGAYRYQSVRNLNMADESGGSSRGFGGGSPEDIGNEQMVPRWSTEDKSERILVKPSFFIQMLQTNLPLTIGYLLVLLGFLGVDSSENLQIVMVVIVVVFIQLQTVSTLLQAIPQNYVSTEELDDRTTAIIFISMVLYPCLGMWVVEHEKAWRLPGIDRLWIITDPTTGAYTWGYVFPFFLWGLSALMFSRGAFSAFQRDTAGVVTGEDGRPITQLYRTIPGFWEVMMAKGCRIATMTPWHMLPEQYKPGSHSGRFLFQLLGHLPLMFIYIGFRFIAYSAQQIGNLLAVGPYVNFVEDRTISVPEFIITARLIVWTAFFFHTIVLRAFLPSILFLQLSIQDPQSLYYRSIGWQHIVTPTKRTRLLWGFRGFIIAFVPFCVHRDNIGLWDLNDFWRVILWFLFGLQLVSYLLEGVMALFWALNEAARSCHMNHPLEWLVSFFFWSSYNAYLQPVGTCINVFFYVLNKEGLRGVVLMEIWGPLVERGEWRPSVQKYLIDPLHPSWWLDKIDKKEIVIDNDVKDRRKHEWIDTWRRKRLEVGKTMNKSKVVERPDPDAILKEKDKPAPVFSGTLFPTKEEWLVMRDHPEHHIPLDPWNQNHPEDKFKDWYPSYSEEIIKLLQEPYDFDVKREIWMFGFGSLLSPDTPPAGLTGRQRKLLLPYWLKKSSGYKNSFSYRHGGCSINALGLIPVEEGEEGRHVAGCVYPIDYETACELFSVREDGYEFLLVAEEHFQAMHSDYKMPEGVGYVWMCGKPIQTCGDRFNSECDDWSCKCHVATVDSPILQSYVDSIMAGALRYATSGDGQDDGMKFCAAIISTIQDWDFPWFNDRIISGRPWVWRKEYEIIDGLLNTCPNTSVAFAKRMGPVIASPGAPRQRLLIRDELRYEAWASDFFSPWQQSGQKEPAWNDATKAVLQPDSEGPSFKRTRSGQRRESRFAQTRLQKLKQSATEPSSPKQSPRSERLKLRASTTTEDVPSLEPMSSVSRPPMKENARRGNLSFLIEGDEEESTDGSTGEDSEISSDGSTEEGGQMTPLARTFMDESDRIEEGDEESSSGSTGEGTDAGSSPGSTEGGAVNNTGMSFHDVGLS